MRGRRRNKLPRPVHVKPGDRLICRVWDSETGKFHQFEDAIGRKLVIDTVVTFDLDESALGLKAGGIGAVFGQEA